MPSLGQSIISLLAMQLTAAISSVIILSSGWIANIYVLIIIFRNRKYKTLDKFHCLLASLALYDILTLLLYWPYELNQIFNHWYFGEILCHICNGFTVYFNAASALTIVAMAIDRYQIAVKVTISNVKSEWKLATVIIIAIIALAFSLPSIIFTDVDFNYVPFSLYSGSTSTAILGLSCHLALPQFQFHNNTIILRRSEQIYYTCGYVLLYILPLIIVIIIFAKTKHHFSQPESVDEKEMIDSHKKMIQMVLVLMITHVIVWTPLFICNFRDVYGAGMTVNQHYVFYLLRLISKLMGISKCAINPVIYAYFCPYIKHPLIYLLKQCFGSPSSDLVVQPLRPNEVAPLLSAVEKDNKE
ncbi:uncharacterized protein TRIADDRAFT_62157 [Trichoplax adhaerens]|uniref:G-protein coupled receptors family 1 profile domain-containing protein n=1 Tax=Trichoplax adhaerens TaxID=10228 RepID=B3SD00_TRIAD|nr:hypothetical protein TRIADDRAFT_62157 [Trichoplax adhaerens]EDV19432.1 hypothetical protein TRIADDRAFT_62157 [Trichoplax adhaerens]|eukprot:XP_002118121.1 hypothetical protein TRIADDRAFT_62157 [Trichoplax adhaerens]